MKKITGSIVFSLVIIFSCKNDLSFKKTNGGMPYKVYPGSNGKNLKVGDIIKVQVIQKIKDSVAFDTHNKIPVYTRVDSVDTAYDIAEIWRHLKTGDSIVTVQMIDTFIKRAPDRVPPHFKNGDKIVTSYKILDAFPNMEAYTADFKKEQDKFLANEIHEIESYLAKKNIKAQKTGKGTFVEIKNPGSGAPIDSGKYVTLNYTGTSYSGKVFDSNTIDSFGHKQPLGFIVDVTPMGVAAFHDGVKLLRKGGVGTFYIPSTLAYGANSPSPDIKPYEHLIFDIEVVDVKDKAPETNNGMPPPPKIKMDTTQRRK
jgi:FKBP-type peptidyl-prolyl cis-trans isomerase FkpA